MLLLRGGMLRWADMGETRKVNNDARDASLFGHPHSSTPTSRREEVSIQFISVTFARQVVYCSGSCILSHGSTCHHHSTLVPSPSIFAIFNHQSQAFFAIFACILSTTPPMKSLGSCISAFVAASPRHVALVCRYLSQNTFQSSWSLLRCWSGRG